MKTYIEKKYIFKRYWGWFMNPHDVSNVAIATFFSYEKLDAPGFSRKEEHTAVIDLTQSLDEIWVKFRKSFIQLQIKQGERRGIVVSSSTDFNSFNQINTAFRKGKSLHAVSPEALAQNGLLFLAHYEGQPIAGGVFIADGKYMRVWVLASKRLTEKKGHTRQVIGEANRMIIWEAIKYAHTHGYVLFDFCGIARKNITLEMKAINEFKEGFGGEIRLCYFYRKTYIPFLGKVIENQYIKSMRASLRKIFF